MVAQRQSDLRRGQGHLFVNGTSGPEAGDAPVIALTVEPWSESDKLKYEKEVLDFYLSSHPLAQHDKDLRRYASHKVADFNIYPGAPHGFHADYRPSYRKDAAEDAWQQMQAWLRTYHVLG